MTQKRLREEVNTYLCTYPTFDEYVYYGLGHKVIHNLLHPKSNITVPSALECTEAYCNFMQMNKQLEYVYRSIPIRYYHMSIGLDGYHKKLDVGAILPLYNIKSGEFNKGDNPKLMGELDKIFENAPPLTNALTVYRKYECPPNLLDINKGHIFMSNRFLSTSLSLSYLSSVTFWDECPDDFPIYCRIDIMPGVKVLPLLDRVEMATSYESSISELTEFEILLPRNALLYKLTESYSYENTPTITIIHIDEQTKSIVNKNISLPIIHHHFVLAPNEKEFNIQYPKHTVYDIQPQIINVKLTDAQINKVDKIQQEITHEQVRIMTEEKDKYKQAEWRREYGERELFEIHDKKPRLESALPTWEIELDSPQSTDEEWEDGIIGGRKTKRTRKLRKQTMVKKPLKSKFKKIFHV
jgi:hypothetical protein